MDELFTGFANCTSRLAGRPFAFILSVVSVVVWAVTGPLFDYSDTWQLVINTATTVITFLMVFDIQNSQNRDGSAMQAKLDELLRAVDKAREGFVGIEHLTDEQIENLRGKLEEEVGCRTTKQETIEDSVDTLLERY